MTGLKCRISFKSIFRQKPHFEAFVVIRGVAKDEFSKGKK